MKEREGKENKKVNIKDNNIKDNNNRKDNIKIYYVHVLDPLKEYKHCVLQTNSNKENNLIKRTGLHHISYVEK